MWSLSLPNFDVQPEVRDLAIGTLIMATIIAWSFFSKNRTLRSNKKNALKRSLSCPGLVELQKSRLGFSNSVSEVGKPAIAKAVNRAIGLKQGTGQGAAAASSDQSM